MRDIQRVLELWGAWAASDWCNIDYSSVAAGFKGLLPQSKKMRPMCSDNDGLMIEGCMAKLLKKRPCDYQLLVAYYVYMVPKRQIAKSKKKNEKQIRIEMMLAEGFVEGCLAMLNVKLESDF